MLTILIMYALVGAVAGVLAGLLGIGGGLVIVPMLVYCFELQGIPHDVLMHLALGTSMASIVFTSVSSARSHHKRGAVDWSIFKKIVVGILTGSFIGTFIASWLSTDVLKVVFVVFLYYVCIQLFLNKKPKPSRTIPGTLPMFGVGNGVGIFSALVGIGGGTLTVPFMLWCNTPAHTAVGTASAIGFPIAVSATIGFIINGLNVPTPDYSLGFVYIPALLGIVLVSVFTAPIGVRLAHSLPVDRLKRVFAILLLVVATRMLVSVF